MGLCKPSVQARETEEEGEEGEGLGLIPWGTNASQGLAPL